ncbi:transporter substrate-binding domain-containing protein [Aerosakkonemataceae cyanobacterium BLCC-F50]|uniref:Transporter substrate-binding domain-containing protein n=1 Tax=Floridaenema flaviceps BLCC-F50 TaxID=3153642 RepID=A0ABV4XQB6_9CYAN
MNISRRFILQSGTSFLLTASIHGCMHNTPSTSHLKISDTLLTQIEKRGYLLVATEEDYPPFEFLLNGKPAGFDNELLTRLRQEVPFEIRQEMVPWQGILPGVAEGKYDVALTAAGITDERAQFLSFTTPIAESTIAYLKRKDDTSIQEIQSLSGKVLGVKQGGISLAVVPELATELKKQGGTLGAVKQYRSYGDAYQDLINENIDVVLNNIVSLSVLVDEKPAIFELGERVSRKSYAAWAVKQGNQELLDVLNQFLQRQKAQGELKKLQEYWFKVTFDDLPEQPLLPGDRPIYNPNF